jgi:hypothetical protein
LVAALPRWVEKSLACKSHAIEKRYKFIERKIAGSSFPLERKKHRRWMSALAF